MYESSKQCHGSNKKGLVKSELIRLPPFSNELIKIQVILYFYEPAPVFGGQDFENFFVEIIVVDHQTSFRIRAGSFHHYLLLRSNFECLVSTW